MNYQFTKERQQEARDLGFIECPECTKPMKLLGGERSVRKEYYCEHCHVSVPTWRE